MLQNPIINPTSRSDWKGSERNLVVVKGYVADICTGLSMESVNYLGETCGLPPEITALMAIGTGIGVGKVTGDALLDDYYFNDRSKGSEGGTRNRIGNPIDPMEKTYEMALNPELQANEVAAKYGIKVTG